MTALILIAALAAQLPQVPATTLACVAAASAPALDHVVLVVRDLEQASVRFREHGFRLKQGRLHANNLLNRHVKFRDGTSIELMTVQGEPGDAMARRYAALLDAGAGAVYVSLTVPDIAPAREAAANLRLSILESSSGPWRFVSFPAESPAAAVFFSSGTGTVQDPDSLVSHVPAVTGLAEVWLEGGRALGDLLERMGAKHCGSVLLDGRTGERFALGRGSLVITEPRGTPAPRVLGAVLQLAAPGAGTVFPHPEFRVQYRYEGS